MTLPPASAAPCGALRVHATIEEELFYPAFPDATDDKDLHHEAEIEHHVKEEGSAGPPEAVFGPDAGEVRLHAGVPLLAHFVRQRTDPQSETA